MRRILAGSLAVTGIFALAGALLATIAWARAQYPLLEAAGAIGLAARWAADLAPIGALLGLAIALGLRAAGVRSRATPLAAGLGAAAVACGLALRGDAPAVERPPFAPAPIPAVAAAATAPRSSSSRSTLCALITSMRTATRARPLRRSRRWRGTACSSRPRSPRRPRPSSRSRRY